MVPLRLSALSLLVLAACDPTVADEPDPAASVLVLPVVGVDEIEDYAVLQPGRTPDGEDGLVTSSSMNLGFGPAYPSELELSLGGLYHVRCGELRGSWRIEEVTSSDDATVRVGLDESGATTMEVLAVGTSTVDAIGTYTPQREECGGAFDGRPIGLHIQHDVTVLEPTGMHLEAPGACGESDRVRAVLGAPLMLGMGVFPTDSDGNWIGLRNAVPRRELELRITAPAGGTVVSHGSDELGLGGVWFEDGTGVATVEPSVGDAFDIEVLSVGDLTTAGVQFTVPWGMGRSDLIVEDGGTYGDRGWGGARNVIEPRIGDVLSGTDPVCSAPQSDWFELRSGTPDTCTVVTHDPEPGPNNWGHTIIAPLAEVRADGLCSLTLAAPEFDGRVGFEVGVDATLVNTDAMNPRE